MRQHDTFQILGSKPKIGVSSTSNWVLTSIFSIYWLQAFRALWESPSTQPPKIIFIAPQLGEFSWDDHSYWFITRTSIHLCPSSWVLSSLCQLLSTILTSCFLAWWASIDCPGGYELLFKFLHLIFGKTGEYGHTLDGKNKRVVTHILILISSESNGRGHHSTHHS